MSSFLGIDIGGTSAKLILLDRSKQVLAEDEFDIASCADAADFSAALKAVAGRMLSQVPGQPLSAVGVGCTGPININTGIVVNPFTLPVLQNVCLSKLFSDLLGAPVFLENDANAAHLGEAWALGPEDPGDTALVTLGTGVGCSIRMGYRLFTVPGGVHPEMGHTSCGVESDIKCYCGRTNCMENILSGTAVNRDAARFFHSSPEEVFERCDTPKKKAFCKGLSDGLYNTAASLAGLFNSRLIILSGGMNGFYAKYLMKEVNERLKGLEEGISPVPTIVPARLGKRSGRIGAALLAMDHLDHMEDQ